MGLQSAGVFVQRALVDATIRQSTGAGGTLSAFPAQPYPDLVPQGPVVASQDIGEPTFHKTSTCVRTSKVGNLSPTVACLSKLLILATFVSVSNRDGAVSLCWIRRFLAR